MLVVVVDGSSRARAFSAGEALPPFEASPFVA